MFLRKPEKVSWNVLVWWNVHFALPIRTLLLKKKHEIIELKEYKSVPFVLALRLYFASHMNCADFTKCNTMVVQCSILKNIYRRKDQNNTMYLILNLNATSSEKNTFSFYKSLSVMSSNSLPWQIKPKSSPMWKCQ